MLETLSEFPPLHQFPSENRSHDLQLAYSLPSESTVADGYSGVSNDDFSGANSGAPQVPEEPQHNYNQYYTSYPTTPRGMFSDPQNEWPSSPSYHATSATSFNPHLASPLSGDALQDHGPDSQMVWPGYNGGLPSSTDYSGAAAPPGDLGGEVCNLLQFPSDGPSTSTSGTGTSTARGYESQRIIRKKGGASLALRGAADRRRKRPRLYHCEHCDDSFTSRQNLRSSALFFLTTAKYLSLH